MIAFQLTSGFRMKKIQGKTTRTNRMATNSSGGTSRPLACRPKSMATKFRPQRTATRAARREWRRFTVPLWQNCQ